MKLYATVTSERGKPVNKSGNDKLEVLLTIDRVEIGRMVARREYDGYTIKYFPITENTGRGGYTLLHEQKD